MHDQILVRMLNRGAHCTKQLETLWDRQPSGRAMLIDRHAVDEFHDHVRYALLGRASVEHPRDARMIEPRENLPLGVKAPQEEFTAPIEADHLHRHLALERSVGPHGPVYRAHAALADLLKQLVGAEALARKRTRPGSLLVWDDPRAIPCVE